MKILFAATSLDPRTGGTAEAVRQWAHGLQRLGHVAEAASLDAPGSSWPGWEVPVHARGRGRKGYGYAPEFETWLRHAVRGCDAVIVNGLWQYTGVAVRRSCVAAGVPYYLVPHGMLDPWFRRAYPLKHLKKWTYWQCVERLNARQARAVVFTCGEERRLASQSFGFHHPQAPVVSPGVAAPAVNLEECRGAFHHRFPESKNRSFFLYLSRIHPKKGLDLLLQAYAGYRRKGGEAGLVVAGDSAENSWAEWLRREFAASNPDLDRDVVWTGLLQGSEKWGALAAADALVLPSHQENFGLAVVEALACGTPVLISNRINIWREITEAGAGLAAEDTPAGVAHLLMAWQQMTPEERGIRRREARSCFEKQFEAAAAARSLAHLLEGSGTGE